MENIFNIFNIFSVIEFLALSVAMSNEILLD